MNELETDLTPGQARAATSIHGELYLRASDIAMATEVRAERQFDPDAKQALKDYGQFLMIQAIRWAESHGG